MRGPVAVAAATMFACYALARLLRRPLPAAGLGVLAGWVALAWPGVWRSPPWGSVLYPRQVTDFLLLPALAFVLFQPWTRRGRWVRWGPVWLAAGLTWWVAHMPGGQEEFWRVWAVASVAVWVLARGVGAIAPGKAVRASAAAAALAGGLAVTGAPLGWLVAALVLLVSGPVAPVLTGVTAVAASLGAGRLGRGGFGPVDAACVGSVLVPVLTCWLQGQLQGRLSGRLSERLSGTRRGRAGPWVAAAGSVLLACAIAGVAGRLLRA